MAFTWHQVPTWACSIQRQAEMLFPVLKAARLHPHHPPPTLLARMRSRSRQLSSSLCYFLLWSQDEPKGTTEMDRPQGSPQAGTCTAASSIVLLMLQISHSHLPLSREVQYNVPLATTPRHCWRVTDICSQMSMGWQLTSALISYL